MNLTELPIDILATILTYLDTKSKINLYSIEQLRYFFTPYVTRKWDISRSIMASATLGLDIFQDLAANIHELNLSGVKGITSAFLNQYLKRFKNLLTLDVTFTEIFLSDLQDICCESLKNIHINYFQKGVQENDDIWKKTIEVFNMQTFEIVHFVVMDFNQLDSPYTFIKEVPILKDLKITLAHNYSNRYWWSSCPNMRYFLIGNFDTQPDIHFKQLTYNVRDFHLDHIVPDSSALLRKIFNFDYSKLEYIFIMYSEIIYISVSPRIHSVFSQLLIRDLSINVSSFIDLTTQLDGNVIFKAWNKDVTVFDNKFFESLLIELADYFPSYICTASNEIKNVTKKPYSRWYCLDSCSFKETIPNLPEKVSLADFCRSLIEDEVDIEERRFSRHKLLETPLAIQTNKNLTFLSINNICWADDFYGVLFKECNRLRTLDVNIGCNNSEMDYNCCELRLLDSLRLTKSLQNLRITTETIKNYRRVFDCLTECPSLENVSIAETSVDLEYDYELLWVNRQNISSVVEKCPSLYSLFIQANIQNDNLIHLEDLAKSSAQEFGRKYLHVKVCSSVGGWNPFADVFSPSPLHIKH